MARYGAIHFCDYEPQFVDDTNPRHQKQLLRGYRTYWRCQNHYCLHEIWCKDREYPPGYVVQAMAHSGITSLSSAPTVTFTFLEFDTKEELDEYYKQYS